MAYNKLNNMEGRQNKYKRFSYYHQIPYALISNELKEMGRSSAEYLDELNEIGSYYDIYKNGADFLTEGSHNDYLPATLRYKLSQQLINKQARFLVAETPEVTIDPIGDSSKITETSKKEIGVLNEYVNAVLRENRFEDILMKAAKDCFIGKRIAALVNFNESSGPTIQFYNSLCFLYETDIVNRRKVTRFVCFDVLNDSIDNKKKRILKKKYVLETNDIEEEVNILNEENEIVGTEVQSVKKERVYLQEELYDGSGKLLREVFEYQPVKLKQIPSMIIINDGLTGESKGESDIDILCNYEQYYSRLANQDIDAERKGMNPIKYTIDMDSSTTEGLSTAAGSFWDMMRDSNLPNGASPEVGLLESTMAYKEALDMTLGRIRTTAFDQVEMPDVSLESMTGIITSGKALKAVYWGLIVRCKEKFKSWEPQLRKMVKSIINGSLEYPNAAQVVYPETLPFVQYEVHIEQNFPLPEDTEEEKTQDLAEVEAGVMSRKAYMKKWRRMNDQEVNDEIKQMVVEKTLLEDNMFGHDFSMSEDDGINDDDIDDIETQIKDTQAEVEEEIEDLN